MSIRAISYVFDLHLPPLEKWLLVCLADNANESGGSIYPSIDTLVQKCGLSRATVLRLKRKLEVRGLLLLVAPATASRPVEYRIPVVPRELRPKVVVRKDPDRKGCPAWLRQQVIQAFAQVCQYCRERGTVAYDPQGQWWVVDRLTPGRAGGRFEPRNVTLSCRRCQARKRATWERPQTLADVEGGSLSETPEGALPETPGGSLSASRGLSLSPEPLIDPSVIRKNSGRRRAHESPEDYVRILTRVVHRYLDRHPDVQGADLLEEIKTWAAQHVPGRYNSDVCGRAIDSAIWQRQHLRKADRA